MNISGRNLVRERILIAEIGNNHEGDAKLALELVHAAVDCGVDAVKVQVIDPERLVNISQTGRVEQLNRFQLTLETYEEMADIARSKDALFMASALDLDSLGRIAPLLDAVKIASGDLDFHPLLMKASFLRKPIILSTGMSNLGEIKTAVDVIARCLKTVPLTDWLALLHCVSLYPAPMTMANLRAIRTLHDSFGLTVGYSDHTLGIESAVASLAMGARMIEKHFTLDKARSTFRDHALSSDPDEMHRLADVVHHYDDMLGSGDKTLSKAELEMAVAARRSIVAARDLPAGTILKEEDLDCVRPRIGLVPADLPSLMGKRLLLPLKRHDPIMKDQVN
jgi:N-acetylneuraminate synthase/N,N'-diacetyllegionaminate synthase